MAWCLIFAASFTCHSPKESTHVRSLSQPCQRQGGHHSGRQREGLRTGAQTHMLSYPRSHFLFSSQPTVRAAGLPGWSQYGY